MYRDKYQKDISTGRQRLEILHRDAPKERGGEERKRARAEN